MRGVQLMLFGLSGGRMHHDGASGYGPQARDVGRADEGSGLRDANAGAVGEVVALVRWGLWYSGSENPDLYPTDKNLSVGTPNLGHPVLVAKGR
jgi:hypothetical protein